MFYAMLLLLALFTNSKQLVVYSDIFSVKEDEVIDNSYKLDFEYDDVIMKAQSYFTSKLRLGSSRIAGNKNNDDMEDDEFGSDMKPEEKVNSIEYNYGLHEWSLTKGELMTTFKAYLKKLVAHLQANGKTDRVKKLKAGALKFINRITQNFDDWTFYQTKSYDFDTLIFSHWEDLSASGPVFYYFKDGLKEERLN